MTQAYPLQWPDGWPRTRNREYTKFHKKGAANEYGWRQKKGLTVAEAVNRLSKEFDLLGARLPVLSTNVETSLDGLPRSNRAEPADPGVAAYFQLDGKPYVLACDKWDTVAGNIVAVAKHIEAMRGMERWGVGSLNRMFEGFTALPSPKSWQDILGFPPNRAVTKEDIEAAYRAKAKKVHPDLGGSGAAMAELNAARDQALSLFRYGPP